jgi:glucose/arabinose dehydrogenase
VQAPAGASSSPATTTETADAAATPGFNAQQVALNVQQVASGFDQPVFVTHAGDGSRRMFVVEKGGVIKLLDGQTFIDISDRVRSSGSEQGLLGLAFHPQFAQNGLFFVNYIDRNGNTVVSRFSTTADKQRGDPASEQVLLRQEQPAANHNGGMVAFGPDGMLYIGLGDGGGANDQFGNGQNLQTWLGTLLRIDVNSGATYAVPPNNPFVKNASARPEIWAYGLRNPWRFSFDRATGDLYIADVGQNQWEEIDAQPANSSGGENYGWSIREGAHCFRGSNCETTGLVDPIAEYEHGLGCSVTGGYVYRGASYPALQGAYIFGDYCTGRIWTAARNASGAWQTTEMLQLEAQISSFGEDEAGELYLTDIGSGSVYQVTAQER